MNYISIIIIRIILVIWDNFNCIFIYTEQWLLIKYPIWLQKPRLVELVKIRQIINLRIVFGIRTIEKIFNFKIKC